jgi:mono/diheme cytochrome c family protein
MAVEAVKAVTTPLALALLAGSIAPPAQAQTLTGDATRGQALYDNTVAANFQDNCTACHGGVENRRIAIGTSLGLPQPTAYDHLPLGDIETQLDTAIRANQGDRMRQYLALNAQQFQDLVAYLGDTPQVGLAGQAPPRRADVVTFDFAAPAVGQPLQLDLELQHAQLPGADLQVRGVAVTGLGGAAAGGAFRLAADSCTAQRLAASARCSVSVAYQPTSAAAAEELLSFELQVGGTTFTRRVLLAGSVNGTPSTPVAPPSNQGAGGASGPWSLLGLGLAGLALRRLRGRAGRVDRR